MGMSLTYFLRKWAAEGSRMYLLLVCSSTALLLQQHANLLGWPGLNCYTAWQWQKAPHCPQPTRAPVSFPRFHLIQKPTLHMASYHPDGWSIDSLVGASSSERLKSAARGLVKTFCWPELLEVRTAWICVPTLHHSLAPLAIRARSSCGGKAPEAHTAMYSSLRAFCFFVQRQVVAPRCSLRRAA